MNKEITIYELLGLIKDGQDVGKFWWNGCIHEVDEYNKIYDTYCRKYKELTLDCLNDKVKIIEEDKKIEKFSPCLGGIMSFESVEHIFEIYEDEINYLIDEVNKLKEKKT